MEETHSNKPHKREAPNKPFIDVYIFKDGFPYKKTPIISWRQEYLNSLCPIDVEDSTLVWRLLEVACRKSLGMELNDLNPRRLETGRTVINNYYISLSHSGGLYMVAISSENIGVDVQKVRGGGPVGYNSKAWTDGEKKCLGGDGPSNYKYWTRKEALYKFLDPGIKYNEKTWVKFDTSINPYPSFSLSGSIDYEYAYWSVVSPLIIKGVVPNIYIWPHDIEMKINV